ncbi:hypothetical protein NDN08_004433 [Rhodosorus marinus]|uniref:EF-hand domain-containing protein n=1 Tax=Rhodosorus marinus TaxID=101924 RepID=A0AAV8ULA1_9RHOD|nr:hypothetical protein NDN08_004433 [Rhodosorus marinus]
MGGDLSKAVPYEDRPFPARTARPLVSLPGNMLRFGQSVTLAAGLWTRNLVTSAEESVESSIKYPVNFELDEMTQETKRESGRFSIEFATLAARLACFSYLEGGMYWRSDTRPVDSFHVTHPSQFSIGMLAASNKIPAFVQGFEPDLIPESVVVNGESVPLDTQLASGWGRVNSGLLKEFDSDTDVVIMHDVKKETIYIMWQGTQSNTDAINDVRFLPRYWPYGNKSYFASEGFVRSHEAVIMDVRNTIEKLWSTNQYKKIFVVGHSLGGILANLNAHALSYLMQKELEETGLPKEERLVCYTFGAPRGMTWELRNDYNERVPHSYRFRNDEDIVPRIPSPNKYHAGIPIILDEHRVVLNFDESAISSFIDDKSEISEAFSDHHISSYLSHIIGLQSRLRVTPEQSDQIEKAFASLVEPTDQKQAWTILQPTEKSKTNPLARYLKVGVDPVPLPAGVKAILQEAFGKEKVTDEICDNLLYYSSKLNETHIFDLENSEDVQEVSINCFRTSFSELVLESDKALNIDKLRYRLAFDQMDSDKNGLLSPREFVQAAMTVRGEGDLSKETEDEEIINSLRKEFKECYNHMKVPYPEDPNMELSTVSFTEFYIWAKENKIAAEQLR